MKVILLEKINNLGEVGDIVNIKNGYAKNYIFPGKKGILATNNNIEKIKNNLINKENKSDEIKDFKKINDLSILIPASVKKNDEIYGSFNYYRLSKIIKKLNIKLKARSLDKNFSAKKIGNYKIVFKNKKLSTEINIHIILVKSSK